MHRRFRGDLGSRATGSGDMEIAFDLAAHVQRRQLWRRWFLKLGLFALVVRFVWSIWLLFATNHGLYATGDAEATLSLTGLSAPPPPPQGGIATTLRHSGGAGTAVLTLSEQRQLLWRYLGLGDSGPRFGAGVLPPASGNILDLLVLLKGRVVGPDETMGD